MLRLSMFLAIGVFAITGLSTVVRADADGVEYFEKEVLPIFKANCYSCHGGKQVKGEFRLSDRASLLKGGESGDPAFDKKSPIDSVLLAAVRYDGLEMPPKGKLAASQIAKIEKWIKHGAPYPEHMLQLSKAAHHGPPPVNDETKKWWSFQPVSRPVVPSVKN
jgi:mono/diheme cytochrome c family protein